MLNLCFYLYIHTLVGSNFTSMSFNAYLDPTHRPYPYTSQGDGIILIPQPVFFNSSLIVEVLTTVSNTNYGIEAALIP